jgi:hypothetical protein
MHFLVVRLGEAMVDLAEAVLGTLRGLACGALEILSEGSACAKVR